MAEFNGKWKATITYEQGDVVMYNAGGTDTVFYRSLQNNNLGKNPKTQAAYWQSVTLGGETGTFTCEFGTGPDADRLAINGVVQGPHLTGPQGDTGNGVPLGTTHEGQIASFDANTQTWILSNAETAVANDIMVFDGAKYAPQSAIKDYCYMYTGSEAVAQDIKAADQFHAVVTANGTGAGQGFSFVNGATATVLSFADYSGTEAGTVKCTTTAPHGMLTGDIVTIVGTTNYNGAFEITKIDEDEFYFTDTWVANDAAGTVIAGECVVLDTGREGVYEFSLDIAYTATTGKVYEINLMNGTSRVAVIYTESDGKLKAASIKTILSAQTDDRFWVSVVGKTDATDITLTSYSLVGKLL